MRNPIKSTGWVIRTDDSGKRCFSGTCFGLYKPNILVTAHHVIRGAEPGDVTVSRYRAEREGFDEGLPVKKVVQHPSADLAILILDEGSEGFDYFRDVAPFPEMGTDVAAFGYPADTGESGLEPTPRYFKGHVQRSYRHKSYLRYEYDAGELSFGAPGGLSGGPVSNTDRLGSVMGLVTENRENIAVLSSKSKIVDGGVQYHEEVRSVINYATCLLLAPMTDWLLEHIRPGLMQFLE